VDCVYQSLSVFGGGEVGTKRRTERVFIVQVAGALGETAIPQTVDGVMGRDSCKFDRVPFLSTASLPW
jgi:hypothetical protein